MIDPQIFFGFVEGGRFHPDDKNAFSYGVSLFESRQVEIECREHKQKRFSHQNAAWWLIMVPAYAKAVGYFKWEYEAAHYELVKILKPETTFDMRGRERVKPKSTRKMPTDEFADLYKMGQDFMAAEYGIFIPDPDPKLAKRRRIKSDPVKMMATI